MTIIRATVPVYEHEWEEFAVPLPPEPPAIAAEAGQLTDIAHSYTS